MLVNEMNLILVSVVFMSENRDRTDGGANGTRCTTAKDAQISVFALVGV